MVAQLPNPSDPAASDPMAPAEPHPAGADLAAVVREGAAAEAEAEEGQPEDPADSHRQLQRPGPDSVAVAVQVEDPEVAQLVVHTPEAFAAGPDSREADQAVDSRWSSLQELLAVEARH